MCRDSIQLALQYHAPFLLVLEVYATALCLGASPAKLLFDETAMRPHLIKCLQDG